MLDRTKNKNTFIFRDPERPRKEQRKKDYISRELDKEIRP